MLCFVFAALIVVLDQFFKRWIMITLELRETGPVLIPGIIGLTRWENDGAMLNILAGQQWLLAGIAFIAAFVLIMILLRYNEGFWGTLGLASVLGGTVGNLIDRVFNGGYVIDMFQTLFIRFPIFNIADMFITMGFATFCIHFIALTFRSEENYAEETAYDSDDDYDEYYEEDYDGEYNNEYNEPADPEPFSVTHTPITQIESDIDYFAHLNTAPAPQPAAKPAEQTVNRQAGPVYSTPAEQYDADDDVIIYDTGPSDAEDPYSSLSSLDTMKAALENTDDYDLDDILREYGFEDDKN